MTRFKVAQHCFGKPGSGGPVVALERLLAHSPQQYVVIRQTEAAGGIDVSLIRRFVRELRLMQPDLIHVRGLGNEGFHAVLAARIAGVRNILVSVHGTHRDLTHPKSWVRTAVVVWVLEPLTLLMATHVATVCEYAATRRFMGPFRKKLVGVVENGVEVPVPSVGPSGGVRAQLGIPEDLPIAVCVSRISVEKGYLTLAAAMRILDETDCRFALILVGGGDESGLIRNLFTSCKRTVHFVGHQNDVGRFLRESDLFVFPSLHENLSNALIEAMAHGLPAIATKVGGNIEVLERGGGLLVPPSDPTSLANAIRAVLMDANLQSKLSEQARMNIAKNYSVQRMVSGWKRIYETILTR